MRRRASAGGMVSVAVGALLGAAPLLAGLGAWLPAGATEPASPAAERPGIAREVPATANDLHAPRAHNSPVLTLDPTDERFVALAHRLDEPDFSCGLQVSGDGGRSWAGVDPVVALPEGVDHCYAPQVVFDAEGTLYYLFVGLAGQGNRPRGVWLTTSADRGRSFARPWQILGADNYQVRLAIDRALGEQGRLHLVWLSPEGELTQLGLPPTRNPIMAAHSDDGGETFSEPVEISGPGRQRVVAPAVTVGADHAVHVVYYDLGDDTRDYQGLPGPVWSGSWAVKAASSRNAGAAFADPVVVDDEVAPPERVMSVVTMPPPAATADDDGHVYAGWHDARNGDWDVFAAHSADQGQRWDEPVRINDDEVGNGAHQSLPQLAAAPDGRLDAVFYDRRADPDNHRRHVAYATSHDRGASFSANRPVTSSASDSRTGPRYAVPPAQGHVEDGTGLALHAGDATALAAWPDSRFAVPGTAQQDLYATTVKPTASPDFSWMAVVLAGLVVAMAAAVLIAARRWPARRIRWGPASEDSRSAAFPAGAWRAPARWLRRLIAAARRRPWPARALVSGGVLAGALVVGLLTWLWGLSADPLELPAEPATVEVGLREHAFAFDRPVPAGRVVFRVRNRGDEPHDLVLLQLPTDTVGIDELLEFATPRGLPPVATVPPRQPDETARFAADLAPGRYALVCFVEDADGTPHFHKGMAAEFEVTAHAAPGS